MLIHSCHSSYVVVYTDLIGWKEGVNQNCGRTSNINLSLVGSGLVVIVVLWFSIFIFFFFSFGVTLGSRL